MGRKILAIEHLVLDLYSILKPTLYIILSLFFLSYLCHSESLILNSEINRYICNLLDSYLGFILCLDVIHLVILKGDKLNKYYPLVYKCIVLIFFGCLVIFAFLFLYNLNELCIHIISLLIKNLFGFLVKMMANPQSGSGPHGPGGFGQPTGGGGKPPKKPGGPEPSKGHYEDKEDKPKRRRANYSNMTAEEIIEHKKLLREAKNKRRKAKSDSKTEEEKEEYRAHEREVRSKLKDSLPEDEIELRKEIYNENRRNTYAEDKSFINERRKELFALKDEEDKEFIRENDRERYHNSTYMRELKRLNKRKSRANQKKK
jgi:hypothetical protein